MARTKYKWRLAGFQEIRRSAETRKMLQDAVDDVVQGLPDGYEAEVTSGRSRLRGTVVTTDYEAMLDNEENDSLLRGLGGLSI